MHLNRELDLHLSDGPDHLMRWDVKQQLVRDGIFQHKDLYVLEPLESLA